MKQVLKVLCAIFVHLLVLTSCGTSKRNDIYTEYAKGTKLDTTILKACSQLVTDENYYICLINANRDPLSYDPHVLFFDRSLSLVTAAYFSSEKIERIENKVLYGYLNKERELKSANYREELPEGYSIELKDVSKEVGRSGKMAAAIIDSFNIGPDLSFHLFVKTSKEDNVGYALLEEGIASKAKDSVLTKHVTLNLGLTDIMLHYSNNNVATRDTADLANFISKELYFADHTIRDDFYSQLYQRILERSK